MNNKYKCVKCGFIVKGDGLQRHEHETCRYRPKGRYDLIEKGKEKASPFSDGLCCVCESPTDDPYRINVEGEMKRICQADIAELTRGKLGVDIKKDIEYFKKRKAT